ncbi:hypothetical protein CTAYLR_005990 [Chrysophaeum taylorii]|uniref:EF-hand domain-containing protein n=1 Tax=Chrysophaeum taylorii TaxID=2483200 RepID=A0AAD7XJB6_9STRA|nr:hypothetical protein CTAYLR_005990 [Chrysophaeum taylorii]
MMMRRVLVRAARTVPRTVPQVSFLSTNSKLTVTDSDGIHELQSLDVGAVRRIKAELMEADANHDGRINSEELKVLLRKHKGTFKDREIEELGELFYASKAGGSISYDRFIHAVDVAHHTQATAPGVDANLHFRATPTQHPLGVGKCSVEYLAGGHPVYSEEELDVKLTHTPPVNLTDNIAFGTVKLLRWNFDFFTRWNVGDLTQQKIMLRAIFLETIAAVPGFVGAMFRHFRALRSMQRDGGWTNLLLEEAENEKLHLLTFIRLYEPGLLFRWAVIAGQVAFAGFFGSAYAINPAYCHRLVGYVEEEACATYTKIIKGIEAAPGGSDLAAWRTEIAPAIGRAYWHLGENGTVLDLMKAIRADEANHRDVNHLAAGIKPGQINPFYDPAAKFDQMLLKYVDDLLTIGRPATGLPQKAT